MDAATTKLMAEIFTKINGVCVTVARIEERLSIQLHESPCDDMTAHLQDHNNVKRDWRQAIIGGVVKLVVIAIVAAVSVIITTRIQGGAP